MEHYLERLNKQQYEGATSKEQYIRIIAGAGSGKTSVLTSRIAYLIAHENVFPSTIMAVTFTNKAAKEIKQRVTDIVGTEEANRMFLGTIHSWCARFLRNEASHIGFPKNFTILDEDDTKNIMKEIFHDKYNLPKNDPNITKCLNWISGKKMRGEDYDDIKDINYPNKEIQQYKQYFKDYTEVLNERHSLDFDDLLLKAIDVLQDENNGVRERYTRYTKHILVDEFQDINDVQFKLIELLMKQDTNLYVVGDPDQTIYTWRGANHRLILDLEDYIRDVNKNAKLHSIYLNQNYRSTKNILDAANALIDKNKERLKKDLFTNGANGEKVNFFNARSSKDEGTRVVEKIIDLHKNNVAYKNMAILYRNNASSGIVEPILANYRIPYKIFGGLKFYQRAEIKDIVSYFKLVVNPYDDTAFNRVINIPKRNIGPTALETLVKEANDAGQTLFLYVKENINTCSLKAKSKASMVTLLTELDNLANEVNSGTRHLYTPLEDFLTNIGYFDYIKETYKDDEEDRVDNIKQLLNQADIFLDSEPNSTFEDFVNNAILQASQDDISEGDYVSLMSVHTAKGLEFDYVFVINMAEGIFPSMRSVAESKLGIEEERRLAYVAFTRAKKELMVSSNQDYSYSVQSTMSPSRFVKEAGIYKENIGRQLGSSSNNGYSYQAKYKPQGLKPASSVSKTTPVTSGTNGVTSWNVGDKLEHATFGKGEVVEVIAKLIRVKFESDSIGTKTLIGSHPLIKKL
jgi:DNA helicase II / ATP-dependent DNA helicase PcrA